MKTMAVILAGLTLGLSAPAIAQANALAPQALFRVLDGPQPPPEREPAARAPSPRLIPLEQVRAQIQRSTPGRMLDAEPPDPGSPRPVYRIRWQADSGQRIDFVVDAQTGAILSRSGG